MLLGIESSLNVQELEAAIAEDMKLRDLAQSNMLDATDPDIRLNWFFEIERLDDSIADLQLELSKRKADVAIATGKAAGLGTGVKIIGALALGVIGVMALGRARRRQDVRRAQRSFATRRPGTISKKERRRRRLALKGRRLDGSRIN